MYLFDHWWQVPHIADNSPTGQHIKNIGHHGILGAVPECISKARVILEDKNKLKGSDCYLGDTLRCTAYTQNDKGRGNSNQRSSRVKADFNDDTVEEYKNI